MPIARRSTPPTSQIKEHLSVLSSLSAWTDQGEEEETKRGEEYRLLHASPAEEESQAQPAKPWFDSEGEPCHLFVGLVIILNAVVIGLETDWGRAHFVAFEHCFNTVFFLEMLLRMRQLGIRRYFSETWNLFDFVLVMIGTLDLWVLPIVTRGGTEHAANAAVGYKLTTFRLLRILRLLRVLRVLRLFRMFWRLHLIMTAFTKAFQIVMLISMLVGILDYVLAIVLTQSIGQQTDSWGEHSDDIHELFGTIPRSMSTLFSIMTLTDWEKVSILMMEVFPAPLVLAAFVAYIMVTSYTMMSLVTGIISESMITSQNDYKCRKLAAMDNKRKVLATELLEFLNEMLSDTVDGEGNVRGEDVKTSVRGDTALLKKLAEIDILISESGILSLIDKMSRDGQDKVNINYFVDKLLHLTGEANASYVADLKHEVAKTDLQLANMEKKLEQIMQRAFPEAETVNDAASQAGQSESEDRRANERSAVPAGKRSSFRAPAGTNGTSPRSAAKGAKKSARFATDE